MKIVRYGPAGEEKPGVVDSSGALRSIYPLIKDWTAELITPECQRLLSAIDPEKLPGVTERVRLGTPLANFKQLIAVGLNYHDHAKEVGMAQPTLPLLFHKAIGSLSGPDDPIVVPRGSTKTDWEVELGVVIGKSARNVSAADALKHIAGYCLTMDVSEREWQFDRGGLLNKGKSADSFTPVGPWLLTSDELPDPQSLGLWLRVNDEMMQNSRTTEMIFSVATLIEHVSQYQTLTPGELLLTGTPAGVGVGMKPPRFLAAGDQVVCGIDQLGQQSHRVV